MPLLQVESYFGIRETHFLNTNQLSIHHGFYHYLYKLIKLGYVRPANRGFVMCKDTTYEILKPFPPKYNSVTLMEELRIANGLIPENHQRKVY